MNVINKKSFIINIVAFILLISLFNSYYNASFSIAIIAFVLFVLYDFHQTRKIKSIQIPKQVMQGIIVFFGSILIAAFLSSDYENIRITWKLIYYSMPFFMLAYLNSCGNIQKGIKAGIITVVVIGFVLSFYQYFCLDMPRVKGLLRNPNLSASGLSLILPLVVYIFYKEIDKKTKILYFSFFMMTLFSISLTKTRGIFIAIGVVFIILFIKKLNKIIWPLLIVAILCIYFSGEYLSIMQLVHRPYDMERLYGYQASIKMWLDNPWIGVGIGHWADLYKNIYFPVGAREHLVHAHNMYLFFLSSTGIIGFIGLIYFFFVVLKYLYLNSHSNIYYIYGLSAIIIFMLHGIVDIPFIFKSTLRIFWTMLAIYILPIFKADNDK